MKPQFFGHAAVLLTKNHRKGGGVPNCCLPLQLLLFHDVQCKTSPGHPLVPAEDQLQTGEVQLCHRRLWRGAGTGVTASGSNRKKGAEEISVFQFHPQISTH